VSDATLSDHTIARTLRAVSDSVLDDLAKLAKLETSKRRLQPSDPRRVAVSEEIEQGAQRLLGSSREEWALSQEALAASQRTGATATAAAAPTIEATVPRPVRAILESWRDAERRLAELGPNDEEARSAIEAEIVRVRAEYRAAR